MIRPRGPWSRLHGRWSRLRALALLTAAALLVGACSGSTPTPNPAPPAEPSAAVSRPSTTDPALTPALREFYEQRLRWTGCGGEFRCAQLAVPVDYTDPAGGTIRVSVIQSPATDRRRRIGALIINPGGPGASGLDYARQARSVITPSVRERFDVVGFDPRGVGESSPVDCLSDSETDDFLALDGSPDSAAEQRVLERVTKAFADSCHRRSGALLPHVGTPNVARDVDVLRTALGDVRLYYLGKSYGTLIGASYAELFPRRVGRMVLDGAEDPAVPGDELALAQARGFQRALGAFIADCARISSCPLGRDRSKAVQRIVGLLARIDRSPLRTGEARRLTQSLAVLGIALTLYEPSGGWHLLRVALDQAFGGDGSGLLQLSDLYTDRGFDGHYKTNQNEVIYAVNCLDRPGNGSPAEIEEQLPRFRQASPLFGDYLAWGNLPCGYWPVQSTATPHKISAAGAPPIVVVGTTRDPATPYTWAEGLAAELTSGVLLTYNGDGHTAYARGSSCIDAAVERYLLEGRPPADGKRCS